MSNEQIDNFSRICKTPAEVRRAVSEANALVNSHFRNHKYMGEERIAQWRQTGMLDETAPGSWEETTLVHLLENQRTMKEC